LGAVAGFGEESDYKKTCSGLVILPVFAARQMRKAID
jgi:hypothetical protein